ncbi:hypothetical protein EK21DRAFT_115822 [Setomelanomma holmii]|uniref:CENP-V/GFA domain-containing protein n=1 Tax=Setomelanomma holmii TaxID=210430 RepID=A0A9P4H2N4_9PLEO|nr:hypothetical protein EK21DRAFT_115822 [Setomelanomma holmii]
MSATEPTPVPPTFQDSTPKTPPQSQSATTPAPPKSKTFPSISGSCLCNTIRYRLLTSPLFCYACHCPDCQRITGSAFGLFLQIETYNIQILSPVRPIFITQTRHTGVISRHVECPRCKIELWGNNGIGAAVADIRVGTLDFPGLFEPDLHTFVESKIDWLVLPEGARTVPKDYDYKKVWPKSSLRRLNLCLKRVAEAQKSGKAQAVAAGGEGVGEGGQGGDEKVEDGEKTPTATEFVEGEGEDDEAFEKRYRETESRLQERLEKLRVKLEEEEGTGIKEGGSKGHTGLEELTEKLDIGKSPEEGAGDTKDLVNRQGASG